MLLNLLGCIIGLSSIVFDGVNRSEYLDTSITVSTVLQGQYNYFYTSSTYILDLDNPCIDDDCYISSSITVNDYLAPNGGLYNIDLGRYIFRVEKHDSQYIPIINCFYDNSDYSFMSSFNIVPFVTYNVRFDNDVSWYSYTYFNTYLISSMSQTDNYSSYTSLTSFTDNTRYARYSITFGFIPTAELLDGDTESAYREGYSQGLEDGKNNDTNYQNGYREGYDDARNLYQNENSNINSIFNGILDIGMLPLNFFLTIFNFEIFGINIAGIVGGVLTIFLLVLLIRLILGGKDGD